MAIRSDQSGLDSSVAQDLVFENLGIENSDLGNDEHEFGDGDDLGGTENDDLGLDDEGIEQDDPFAQQNIDDPAQQQQQQPQQRVSHTQKTLVKTDARGNLVDAQGKIIARAGSEARLYYGREKARRDLNTAQASIHDVNNRLAKAVEIGRGLHQQVQRFNAQQEQLQKFGFTSEDQIAAMQLFSEIRKNPADTIRKLLTRAAANGISVNQGQNSPSLDPKGIAEAIKEVLGAELKPIRDQQAQQEQERQRQTQEREQINAVQEEVATFFGRNPEAKQYLPVFKKVMADPKYSGYSLGEIYARILQSNRSQPSNQNGQRSRSRTPYRGSPPNGRNAPVVNNGVIASVDESYDAILKDVMRNAGM